MAESNCPLTGKGAAIGGKADCPKGGSYEGKKKCALGKFICKATKNAAQLGLTDEQVEKLQALKLECKKVKTLDGAQIKVACMDLKAMMAPEKFDLEKAKAQLKKKMDLVTGKKIKQMELYQKAIAVLTPEQLKKMKTITCPKSGSPVPPKDCPKTGGQTKKGPASILPTPDASKKVCPLE